MALIKCKQCGNLISDKATKCPKCGCATNKDLTNYQVDEDRVLAEEPVNYEEDSGSNTKKYLLIALLVAAIVGGGYWWYSQSGDKQEALQFVEQFAKAIEADDRQTVCQLYPNAEKAEAFAISFNKDSIVVSHQNGNDTIDVRLSYKQSLRIVKDDNGVIDKKASLQNLIDTINESDIFACTFEVIEKPGDAFDVKIDTRSYGNLHSIDVVSFGFNEDGTSTAGNKSTDLGLFLLANNKKAFHWKGFCELIKLNMEEWLETNDSI
jgi:hypothetical protein